MITLYNCNSTAGRILDLALRAKSIKHKPDAQSWNGTNYPVILDGRHLVKGAIVICEYLERRYPAPNLIPADPHKASIIMMLLDRIVDQYHPEPLDFDMFEGHLSKNEFIAGDESSFADVAVSALAPSTEFWDAYRKRLELDWGSWDSTFK